MPLSPPLIIEKTKEKAFPARYDETALTLSEGLQPTATLIILNWGIRMISSKKKQRQPGVDALGLPQRQEKGRAGANLV
jgi:hypothetical protein